MEQEWAAASILPSGAVWFLLCIERGALQGLGRYKLVAYSILGEAAARLGFGVLFYVVGLGITGAFLGTSFSIAGLALLLAFPMAKVLREEGPGEERTFRALLTAAWAPVAAFALVAVLQNIDIVFVKHTASSSDAGSYAAASIAAKAVIWVAVGLGLYLLPEAVRRSWRGLDARPVLAQTLALVGHHRAAHGAGLRGRGRAGARRGLRPRPDRRRERAAAAGRGHVAARLRLPRRSVPARAAAVWLRPAAGGWRRWWSSGC